MKETSSCPFISNHRERKRVRECTIILFAKPFYFYLGILLKYSHLEKMGIRAILCLNVVPKINIPKHWFSSFFIFCLYSFFIWVKQIWWIDIISSANLGVKYLLYTLKNLMIIFNEITPTIVMFFVTKYQRKMYSRVSYMEGSSSNQDLW